MGRRLGQLAGAILAVMVVARLARLFEVGPDGGQWQLILLAAMALGALVRWLFSMTRLPPSLIGAMTVVMGFLVMFRVTVPSTLVAGVIPTVESFSAVIGELESALLVARTGIPPVATTPGLIGVLAMLMWLVGTLYMIGALSNRLALMVLPSGVIYLQFAVFDRQPAGRVWMVLTAIVIALVGAALGMSQRSQLGMVRSAGGAPAPARSGSAAMSLSAALATVSLAATMVFAPMVSEFGNLPWQSGSSENTPGGSITFDRFIDLRQRLQTRQNEVVFRATLGPNAPPPELIYWRMEPLDTFDSAGWSRGQGQTRNYIPEFPIGDSQHAYFGTTTEMLQRVFIDRLGGQLVPTAGLPVSIQDLDAEDSVPARAFNYSRDSALTVPRGIRVGNNYQLTSHYPRPDLDIGAMATGPDGQFSPLFAAAAAAGEFTAAPGPPRGTPGTPDDLAHYLSVPLDLPSGLRDVARQVTEGATTDFERAWMLQHWLRDSGDFTYSLNVTTGSRPLNLLDWLTEPTSNNYRTGYCEQFAATMATLARTLGIPSRVVWGFAPGTAAVIDGVDVIEVRDTQAHAWVELWLPGFGWTTFDPTPRAEFLPPSQTAVFDPAEFAPLLPGVTIPTAPTVPVDPPPVTPGAQAPMEGFGAWVVGRLIPSVVIAIGVALVAIWMTKRLRRSARLKRLDDGDIAAAWEEIIDRLTDLGDQPAPSLTPLEVAAGTSPALLPLATSYSAAIYGGRVDGGSIDDLVSAEDWIDASYQPGQKLRGTFNPKSIISRSKY